MATQPKHEVGQSSFNGIRSILGRRLQSRVDSDKRGRSRGLFWASSRHRFFSPDIRIRAHGACGNIFRKCGPLPSISDGYALLYFFIFFRLVRSAERYAVQTGKRMHGTPATAALLAGLLRLWTDVFRKSGNQGWGVLQMVGSWIQLPFRGYTGYLYD